MKMFNADALRRAMADTRAGGQIDAAALVRETLGRHGIAMPDAMAVQPQALAGLGQGFAGLRMSPVPAGAPTGNRHRFSCEAGSREYLLHLPKGREHAPCGLVLMLHGCTQTPEDFALGTGMNAVADAQGLAVVWPAQSRGDNAQSCWNWFSGADQGRERGEPAILAALVRDVAARHAVPEDAIFAAGLSAGAAMAMILGRTHPDLFRGIAAHSGLPFGAARGVAEAFAAMAGTEGARTAKAGPCPPTIVFHGTSDATVAPANGERILRDCLAGLSGQQTQVETSGKTAGHGFRRVETLGPDGAPLAEHWSIEGLSHAWSGGDPRGSYASASGPDASVESVRFFLSLCAKDV